MVRWRGGEVVRWRGGGLSSLSPPLSSLLTGLDCAVRLIGISAASVTSDLNLGTVVPFFAPSARFTLFFHDSTTPTIRLASVSSGTRQAFLARGSRGIAARMSSNSSSSFTKTSIFAVLLSSSSLTWWGGGVVGRWGGGVVGR